MPLIEGVGDEVTQFFIVAITVLVVCIAWWTTHISEQRHLRTVFLIDRRTRNHRTRQFTNNIQAVAPVEGETATMAEATENVENNPVTVNATPSKPPEAGSSINATTEEQNAIIETMDAAADTENVLRQRRVAFYDHRHDTLVESPVEGEGVTYSESSDGNDVDEEENIIATAGEQYQQSENDYVLLNSNKSHNNNSLECTYKSSAPSTSNEKNESSSYIKIKLKYINDDLKLVGGHLQESVGEFKRRHFETELNSNKIIRLIFNGKVLQPDSSSLLNCGLFDNCVVHCLIHNKRHSSVDSNRGLSNNDDLARRNHRQRLTHMGPNNNNNNNNNNNQGRESDLGNILFALISFILGSAWYFRYVYAHLYTVTATVALVVVTGIFSVVVIGMYFPDQETVPPRPEQNEQR